jgi:type II secretory pathway pseudopilin PulG
MKLQKGMTIIEVVIAISLLTLITTMFTSGIMNQIALMKNAKVLTENVFETSKLLETDLQNLREDASGAVAQTFTLFNGNPIGERVVEYYPVKKTVNDRFGNPTEKIIYSVIAAEQVPEAEVPQIDTCISYIVKNGFIVDSTYYDNADDISINVDLTYSFAHMLLLTKYQWYVSSPGFPIPYKDISPNDWGLGDKWPRFPDDYYLIPNTSVPTLKVTESMAGRHIVCVSTPSSLVGKLGRSFVSAPHYIYGLPLLSNLKAHFDASLLGTIGAPSENQENWDDISGNSVKSSYSGSSIPIVTINEFPQPSGRLHTLKAKGMVFTNTNQMNVTGLSLGGTFTMFAVAKSIDTMGGGTIISNNPAWSFDLSEFTGVVNDEWNIFALDSSGNRTIGKNANPSGTNAPVGTLTGGGSVKIGASEVEVAEIIIYDRELLNNNWRLVAKYLGEKYNLS